MKRGIVVVAVVGVLGLLVVGTVGAHRSKVPTTHVPVTITHDGDVLLSDGRAILTGHLKTRRQSCRGLSGVVVKAHLSDGKTKLLDSDLTSSRGAWSVKAILIGVDRVKAKVLSKEIDSAVIRHHHTHIRKRLICESAAVVWRVA
jgi:hypothetical protein